MKICKVCKQEKELHYFNDKFCNKDNKNNTCKKCEAKISKCKRLMKKAVEQGDDKAYKVLFDGLNKFLNH